MRLKSMVFDLHKSSIASIPVLASRSLSRLLLIQLHHTHFFLSPTTIIMPLKHVFMCNLYSLWPSEREFTFERIVCHYHWRGLEQRRIVFAIARYVFAFPLMRPRLLAGTLDGMECISDHGADISPLISRMAICVMSPHTTYMNSTQRTTNSTHTTTTQHTIPKGKQRTQHTCVKGEHNAEFSGFI